MIKALNTTLRLFLAVGICFGLIYGCLVWDKMEERWRDKRRARVTEKDTKASAERKVQMAADKAHLDSLPLCDWFPWDVLKQLDGYPETQRKFLSEYWSRHRETFKLKPECKLPGGFLQRYRSSHSLRLGY